MNSSLQMELQVWSGDWGIPSVNPQSLAILAYLKFSRAPVTVTATNNPWKSPTGNLPVFRAKNTTLTRVQDVFKYLRANNFGCEFDLLASESADLLAYTYFIETKLAPAINHLLWINEKNYSEVVQPWYGKAMGFPLSLYYPNKYRRIIHSQIFDLYPHCSEDDVCMKIYNDARECMNHLSTKLQNKDFFFSCGPTALDAVVYSYLALLLQAPLSINILTGHLEAIDNLSAFIERINCRYFKKEIKKQTSTQEPSAKEAAKNSEDFPDRIRNIILSGLFAAASMVGYALLSGLVSIEITHDDEEDEEHELD